MNLLNFLNLRVKPTTFTYSTDPNVVTRIEEKYDGVRLTIARGHGEIRAYGRRPVDIWNRVRPCLSREVLSWLRDLPSDTIVDGELHDPTGQSSDVSTALKNKSQLTFTPFCFLAYGGGYPVEWDFLAHDSLLLYPPKVLDFTFGLDRDENILTLKAEARRRGIEGYVLKQRPLRNWWKVKVSKTIDAFVTEYSPGEGKLTGKFGAVHVFCRFYESRDLFDLGWVGTGFSEEERAITEDSPVGRVVEIEYDSFTSKNKLRFPRFLRWRDDKDTDECLI